MRESQPKAWSLSEFLVWEEHQPERYELVNGEITMMTGGSQAHALIAVNLISALRPLLRGSPCRPNGSDLKIVIPATGNSRYPDVTIDCGKFDPGSNAASEPTVVFEVLSKSTASIDKDDKLWDYCSVPSIRQYICIYQDRLRVLDWRRNDEGRFALQNLILGPDDVLHVHGLGAPLTVAEIYEGTGLADTPSDGFKP
jgi:Uma2 family endonuclease